MRRTPFQGFFSWNVQNVCRLKSNIYYIVFLSMSIQSFISKYSKNIPINKYIYHFFFISMKQRCSSCAVAVTQQLQSADTWADPRPRAINITSPQISRYLHSAQICRYTDIYLRLSPADPVTRDRSRADGKLLSQFVHFKTFKWRQTHRHMNWTVFDMHLQFIAELILIQINFSPGNSFSKTTIIACTRPKFT